MNQRQQTTIGKPVDYRGFGLWSSRDVEIEFRPADPDTGIVFVRTDCDHARIPGHVQFRIEAPRRTTLACNGVQVEMVEHIMAALAGLQIDNCEVWVNESEMPGADGSSLPFVEVLQQAGIQRQEALRSVIRVTDVTRVGDEETWIEARPAKKEEFSVQYRLDYGSDSIIGRESFRSKITPEIFVRELAPARTFILEHEAQWLRSQGLAQRVTPQDVLVFGSDGVIDNELRFEDECVRHKTLDLIGDLALAGCDFIGQFVAQKSGHRLNAQLAGVLLAENPSQNKWQRSA
ncbi:MAG: UDP-3-O-acyl-N-acetylglucosamine deacetylase [Pirellulaceae bacterium]